MRATQSPRERELRGRDTERLELPMPSESRPPLNPSGLCECGCGDLAPIAKRSATYLGHVKGQPVRFIAGHQGRVLRHTDEAKAKMSAYRRGKKVGPDNPMWKGGRTQERSRFCIRVGRDHPMADRNGLVLEHRLVMAAVLGRYLLTEEIVHHINEDPFDNRPENLVLVNRSQHLAIHALLRAGFGHVEAIRAVLKSNPE